MCKIWNCRSFSSRTNFHNFFSIVRGPWRRPCCSTYSSPASVPHSASSSSSSPTFFNLPRSHYVALYYSTLLLLCSRFACFYQSLWSNCSGLCHPAVAAPACEILKRPPCIHFASWFSVMEIKFGRSSLLCFVFVPLESHFLCRLLFTLRRIQGQGSPVHGWVRIVCLWHLQKFKIAWMSCLRLFGFENDFLFMVRVVEQRIRCACTRWSFVPLIDVNRAFY